LIRKLDEGLVAVGADVAHGVDDPAEGLAELDELLLGALPRHVPQVQHLGRRLRVAELRRRPRRHPRAMARDPPAGGGAAARVRVWWVFLSRRAAGGGVEPNRVERGGTARRC